MHELSLAQGLVDQVKETALNENATRVVRIVVLIGQYSGVERDAFEFAFPFAAEDTLLHGAELIIREYAAEVTCRGCEGISHPEITNLICTHCGSHDVEVTGGREFYIESVDLDVPDA